MTAPQPELTVSVVVPVYNTGPHIEALIDSLARQSLPADQFEAIFVDDGSTDDTPSRLKQLAAERENVSLISLPNSGWPGRPRNVGTDAARGRYVFYVDHDDWLGDEALERMTAFADENRSDVIIGRYAGHRRGVAKALFEKTYPAATLETAPLIDSLTPHKMFRKQFLLEHNLRYPEGKRRLEDHVFVVQAYFLAERISVLSDYHCYFHVRRDDAGNAAYQRIDPADYYRYVREVVAIVYDHTEPGRLRDKCLRRTLRIELLGRLSGRGYLRQDDRYRAELFDEVFRLAEERIPLSVDAGLAPPLKVRAALVRQQRRGDLEAFAARELDYRAVARLTDLRWTDGKLHLEVEGRLVGKSDGAPWRYRREGDRLHLPRPAAVTADLPAELTDCTAALKSANLRIVLRRRADSQEWVAATSCAATVHEEADGAWLSYRASADVDPLTLAGGRPLAPGAWDVFARIGQAGWSAEARVGADRTPAASAGQQPALIGGEPVLPYWTEPHDNLSLEMAPSEKRLASQLVPWRDDLRFPIGPRRHQRIELTLPLRVFPESRQEAQLELTGDGRVVPLDTTCTAAAGRLELAAELPPLGRTTWRLRLRLAGWSTAQPLGVQFRRAGGDVMWEHTNEPDGSGGRRHARRRARRLLGRLRRALRRQAAR